MALPNDSLSQVIIRYTWLGRDDIDPIPLTDYEEGGIALNDTSEGLQYQLWTFTASGVSMYVSAPNTAGPIHLLDADSEVTDIAGCFDQNMNPFLAYKSSGQWHYWWFDTQAHGYVVSDLPLAVTSCRCTLDDKRYWVVSSDILLCYTRNGNLYHRRQRDRYQNELLLRESVGGTIIKVNMNGVFRVQWKMEADRQ